MDATLQKIIDLNTTISGNQLIIKNQINIDGNNFKNKNGNFNFDSEYFFKVTDTFLKGTTGASALNFINFDNITIKNLIIDGNLTLTGTGTATVFTRGATTLTTSGDWDNVIQPIWISNCNNVHLENIVSTNHSGCGISVKNVPNVTIKDCVVTSCYQHGIFVGSSNNKVLIDNCRCTAFGDLGYAINKNIGGIGILVSESNNPTISNNRIIGFADTGTKTEGCSHVEYINNYVENFGKDGLKVMGYNTSVVNVEDIKAIHNTVKNRFNGRSDGSSYIAFHEVTNGIIEGNIIVKDIINDTTTDDGIRINLASGNSSKNIKVINNTLNICSNALGINVGSGIDNAIEDIVIENNNLNRSILINNINKVSVIKNNIKETAYVDTKIFILASSDLIIEKNTIEGLGANDAYNAIYIQPKTSKYIKVINNIVQGCGGRFLTLADTSNKVIDSLDIKDNKVEFGMATMSYPVSGIFLGMENSTITECNLLNNSFITPKTSIDSLFWVHQSTNFLVKLTRLENLILNGDNAAITYLQSQYGRVIGEVYAPTKPTYTTLFKAYDEIKNITPTSISTKWVFDGTQWVAK